jgi:hypothetical protein
MKIITLQLTEEQAEAVGYALQKAIREVKAQPTYLTDTYYQDLRARLATSYDKLDTAPQEEVAA